MQIYLNNLLLVATGAIHIWQMAAVLEWLKKQMEPMFLLKRHMFMPIIKLKYIKWCFSKVRIEHEAWPIKEIFDEEVER